MTMTELEKRQEAVDRAQAELNQLQAEHRAAEHAAIDNPGDREAILAAAHLEVYIKAAEKVLQSATEAFTAEQARLSSPEAAKDLKELDKLNKQMEKTKGELIETLIAVNERFDALEATYKEAKGIAKRYSQTPYTWEGDYLRMIRNQVQKWQRMRFSWLRHKEIMASKRLGAKPVKIENTPERRKMLKERYHKVGE